MRIPWQLKAAGFKALSIAPGGGRAYRFAQRRVTGSTLPSRVSMSQKLDVARGYRTLLAEIDPQLVSRARTFIDYGAGWAPTIPLSFWAAGLDAALLVDVRPNLERDLLVGTSALVAKLLDERAEKGIVRLPPSLDAAPTLETCLRRLGWRYAVPLTDWKRIRELPGPRIVAATQVLLHLDLEAAERTLTEIAAALEPGDVFIAAVKCYDLYADFDPGCSPYNKFRYSERVWHSLVNSPLMSFNRMTVGDYREALDRAGFEMLAYRVEAPSERDLEALRAVDVDRRFRDRPERDLAAREVVWAARIGAAASETA